MAMAVLACLGTKARQRALVAAAPAWGLALGLLLGAPQARAILFGFDNYTPPVNSAGIADQLFMDVTDAGNGNVLFLFRNTGPVAGAVFTAEFADPDGLFSSMSVINYPGVDFSGAKAGPPIPPFDPNFIPGWIARKNGAPVNGIDPGQQLGIEFGADFNAVVNDLVSQRLRVALQVGGLSGGEGEKVIDHSLPMQVPDRAATLALLGLGVGSLEFFRRRTSRRTHSR